MNAALSAQAGSSQTTRPSETKVDQHPTPFRVGTWHEQESRPLDAALAHLADACPALMPLARFVLPRVPRALLASNTLKTENASSHYTILPKAVRRQWIGWNARQQERVNALCIDCDTEGWRERLHSLLERGVPAPAYVAASPAHLTIDQAGNFVGRGYETGHLVWFLVVPVRRDNHKAHDLFRRVRTMLVGELDGDPAAANHLTKNPFHRAYATKAMRLEPVDLADLYKPLMEWCGEGEHALPPRAYAPGEAFVPKRKAVRPGTELGQPDPDEVTKWGKLFTVRHAIMAGDVRDLPTILAMVEEHAAEHCAAPKDHKERRILRQRIKDHARSIHQWMNTAWKGGRGKDRPGIDHGVMTREAHERGPEQARGWRALDEQSKRILAAERTNGLRRDQTVEAVSAAALRLWNEGAMLTQAAVAAAAGVSKREVERLWSDIGTLSKVDTRSYQGFPPQGEPPGGGEGKAPPALRDMAVMSRERARAARVRAEGEARATRDEARRVAALVCRYGAHAAAMGERGALPMAPLCLPLGTRGEGSPEVMAAYQAALDATADATRRHEARVRKAQADERAQERRAMFRVWAEAGMHEPLLAWMDGQKTWWDRVLSGRAGDELALKDIQRRTAFKRYWQDWQEAMGAAGKPVLPVSRGRAPMEPRVRMVRKLARPSARRGVAPPLPRFRTVPDAIDIWAAALPVDDDGADAAGGTPQVGTPRTGPFVLVRPSFLSRLSMHVRVPALVDDGLPF